jgi:hypothetical protein
MRKELEIIIDKFGDTGHITFDGQAYDSLTLDQIQEKMQELAGMIGDLLGEAMEGDCTIRISYKIE